MFQTESGLIAAFSSCVLVVLKPLHRVVASANHKQIINNAITNQCLFPPNIQKEQQSVSFLLFISGLFGIFYSLKLFDKPLPKTLFIRQQQQEHLQLQLLRSDAELQLLSCKYVCKNIIYEYMCFCYHVDTLLLSTVKYKHVCNQKKACVM